ncbi:MAG: DUF58 domain-containing protein [Flammeovirgaceae bacterium]|nr:DUF58 domain-containing protein [Flammeovirgaceae bacterium]
MSTQSNFNTFRQYKSMELLARQLVEGFITGLHKSPYHGFSVEFAEHRNYNEGQSTRHIDWKVFARTDRLFTKQYEEETNLRCLIAIDCSPSMYYPVDDLAKLRFSIHCSSAIAYLLHQQRDAVGLCMFSNTIEEYTPIKSATNHLHKLFGTLERFLENRKQQPRPTHVSKVLHEIAEKTHKRSLIVLFSDMFDSDEDASEIFKALQHLKHNKHEVLLFHVSDHETELAFNFEDRPHEFIDLETKERLRLQPAEIRTRYEAELKTFHHELKLKCNQLKIDFISANAKEDYFHVLQAYLIKRSKMK